MLLLAAGLLVSSAAHGQPSQTDRDVARKLLIEGREKLAAGDAEAALEHFQKAHGLMYVPTTGLDLAKAYGELGRLVEARNVLLEVSRLPADGNAAFLAAQAEASELLKAVDTRIPSIHLRVTGAPSEAVRVTVDGVDISGSQLDTPRMLDPGSHDIVVSAPGFVTEQRRVTLEEGDTKPMLVGVMLVPIEKPTRPFPDRKEEAQPPSTGNGLVYAGVGLTSALVLLGTGTAIGVNVIHAREQEALSAGCEIDCARRHDEYVSTRVGLAYTSLVSFIGAGAVGVATLIYAKPWEKQSADMKEPPRVSFMVAPTLGGLVVQGVW
ncbi:PEGA domain-containing protein [Polyangium spumosum]|nr:PEGA domain-containing protein [Polyangium spumosum]